MGRPFHLLRREDETGTSGVGIVAEGYMFTDGTTVLRWLSGTPSTVVYEGRKGYENMKMVHSHGGRTEVIWTVAAPAEPPAPSDLEPEMAED
jgi:hypothetical protein